MKKIAFLILTLFIVISVQAGHDKDKSKEFGIRGGTAYYLGEVNRAHFGGNLKFGGGIFYRQNVDKRWSFNFGINYLEIGAFDSDSDDPWQANRNLHFKNQIIETSVKAELNFFPYQVGHKTEFFTPYLFTGLAYYSMKPQAELNGFWYELQPLGTEGQGTSAGGEKYNLGGIGLQYGFGIKLNITGRLSCNLTYSMTSSSTDYLDDVSTTYADPNVLITEASPLALSLADRSIEQIGFNGNNAFVERGDPTNNDFYAFTTFALSLRIDKKQNGCWEGTR